MVNHHPLWSENRVPGGISLPPRVGFTVAALCTVPCSGLFEVFLLLRQELKGCSPVVRVGKPSWAWFEDLREGFIWTPWVLFPFKNMALVYKMSFRASEGCAVR